MTQPPKWFRLSYGPPGAKQPYSGPFLYGWRFPAPSMGHAWDTIRRVCQDWRERPYHIAEILDTDFDHPNMEGQV